MWTIDYIDNQGRNPTEITSASNAAVINPTWAPDGRHVVFATVVEPETNSSEKPAQSDLWVVKLDGTGRTNLTNGDFANFQPVWGANGRVYFVSNRGGNDNIWSVAANWAGDPKPGAGEKVVSVPEEN